MAVAPSLPPAAALAPLPAALGLGPSAAGLTVQLAALSLPLAAVPAAPAASAAVPAASLVQRLAEPIGRWAADPSAGGKLEASSDFERRAFGSAGGTGGSGGAVEPPSAGGGGEGPRLPPSGPRLARRYAGALRDYHAAEKSRGRAVYGAAAAMVLAPLTLAGGMKLMALGVIAMPALTALTAVLITGCAALILTGGVRLLRVNRARAELRAAALAVTRASGAQTQQAARQALQDAESWGRALLALDALAPALSRLTALLRNAYAQLDEAERRALGAVESLLLGQDEQPRGQRSAAGLLASSGRLALTARRRLLADDETLTPAQAAAEDAELRRLSFKFAADAGLPDDRDAEWAFLLDRLDRLYENAGPLPPRALALASAAAHDFRWQELGRGRVQSGKAVMALEKLLQAQARRPDADPLRRRQEALRLLALAASAPEGDGLP